MTDELARPHLLREVDGALTCTPVTPELVAELFANLGSDEQARFFNHVAEIAGLWSGGGWPFQLQAITDDDGLTLNGRRVMQEIGEYSHWGLVPDGREFRRKHNG